MQSPGRPGLEHLAREKTETSRSVVDTTETVVAEPGAGRAANLTQCREDMEKFDAFVHDMVVIDDEHEEFPLDKVKKLKIGGILLATNFLQKKKDLAWLGDDLMVVRQVATTLLRTMLRPRLHRRNRMDTNVLQMTPRRMSSSRRQAKRCQPQHQAFLTLLPIQ